MKKKRCDCGAEVTKESKTCYRCGEDLTFMGKMKFMMVTFIFVILSLCWLYQHK